MPRRIKAICAALVLLLAACSSGEIQPVAIEDSDMCSFCRMAISEKRFAAEIIDIDEKVYKFDDIGCMLRYKQASGDKLKPAAEFVTDYDSRDWIRAEKAFYTRSATIKTPMGSNIVAYSDEQKAGPESLHFDQLKLNK